MHGGISSRADFVPTLPRKCLLPSVRKTGCSPASPGLGWGLFLPSILYAAPTGGSSGRVRCQREPWHSQEPPSGPSAAPATRSLATPGLMTAGCPVFPGSRFLVAECPLSLPPPSLFTAPPPTPAWQPCPPPWVLPPALLPLKWPPSGQASPLWPPSLSGGLAAIQDMLGRVVARSRSPITGETTPPFTSLHPGTYTLPLLS